ncbi:hypothetical protein B1R27_12950 [Streptomyces sp. GKU 895]|nr:hypothetical protein B1R27_12950 [Streptomyces sp. GKU 895]
MRPPLFSRLRVGRKLMLLALLPVTGLLALIAPSTEDQWEDADSLRTFHSATDVSFALIDVCDAVARERITAVQAVLRPGPRTPAERAAAERATGRALDRAADRAASWARTDVTGVLTTVGRRLQAVRTGADTGTLSASAVTRRYRGGRGRPPRRRRHLESDAHPQAGQAADAHRAPARRGGRGTRTARPRRPARRTAPPGPHRRRRWGVLEDAELDIFEQNTSDALRGRLHAVEAQAPARAVREVRDLLDATTPETARLPSYQDWTADSGARIAALRVLQDRAARELADAAAEDRHSAESRVVRDLGLAVGVVAVVTGLALALRRSLTRPLAEVAEGARRLSYGELSYDIRYAGRDEAGDVADAVRELRDTTERLAGEIRAMTTAIDRDQLDHRADVAAFDGTWARLLAGLDGTMASYAAEHGRREKAEQERANLFELSPDLLYVCGPDGYLKRVNPALERTLGYPADELLARPFLSFVDERDEERVREGLARLDEDTELTEAENRFLRRDGTELWLRWSARLDRQEGLVHAVARDVTESRRAASEQAALRRVAALVARGAPPREVFQAVAEEVGGLVRHHRDGSAAGARRPPYRRRDRARHPGGDRAGHARGTPAGREEGDTGDDPDAAPGARGARGGRSRRRRRPALGCRRRGLPVRTAPLRHRVAAGRLHRTRRPRARQRRQPRPADGVTRAPGRRGRRLPAPHRARPARRGPSSGSSPCGSS